MWARRVDLAIIEPLTNGFRFSDGLRLFENRVHCIPQAADELKAIAREKLTWLDGLIAGRQYIAGDRFTLADIHLWVFLDFAAQVGQALDPANKNLTAWMARIAERPSAAASAYPPTSPLRRASPLRGSQATPPLSPRGEERGPLPPWRGEVSQARECQRPIRDDWGEPRRVDLRGGAA
jgi:hypothetical protein